MKKNRKGWTKTFRAATVAAMLMGLTAVIGWNVAKNIQTVQAADSDSTGTVSVVLEIELEIEGHDDAVDNAAHNTPFTFEMAAVKERSSDNVPMPARTTVTMRKPGTSRFDAITYTQPGTYWYTVSERDDGAENYVYDDKVYRVRVKVEDDRTGELTVAYAVFATESMYASLDRQEKQASMLFINRYGAAQETEPTTQSTTETTTEQISEPTTEPNAEPETKPTEATTVDVTESTTETATEIETPAPTTPTGPLTGDQTHLLLWIVLLIASVIGVIGFMPHRKHKDDHDDR